MVERGWATPRARRGPAVRRRAEAIETLPRREPRRHRPGPARASSSPRDGKPVGRIVDGDAVVFFNFRGDRAIEISRAFDDDAFDELRPRAPARRLLRRHDAVRRRPASCRSASWSRRRRSTARWASTSRAARRRAARDQRDPEVRPRDLLLERQPQRQVRRRRLETYVEIPSRPRAVRAAAVDEGRRDHRRADRRRCAPASTASLRVNYANGDMVGHTGNFDAAVDRGRGGRPAARAAAAGRSTQLSGIADRHRRPRQRRRDVRARQEGQASSATRRASPRRRPATRSTRCRSC